MAKKRLQQHHTFPNSKPAVLQTLEQTISDVEGLEKLQNMQLRLIREIRRQLTEIVQAPPPSTSGKL